IREVVERIRQLPAEELSPEQRLDVEMVWSNIDAYHQSVEVIIELQNQGKSLHQIDREVAATIDDRPADKAIQRLMSTTRVGHFDIAPQDWFQSVTAKIEQLKVLEDHLAEQLKRRGAALEREARAELAGYRLFLLVIMLVSLGFGVTLVRQLRNKAERMMRLSQQVASGDLAARIPLAHCATPDELDLVALSMNRMVEGLDQTIRLNHQTLRALADSESRVRSMLETAPDAILSLNASGRIESVNPAGERLFGYFPGTMTGCASDGLVPELRGVLGGMDPLGRGRRRLGGEVARLLLEADGMRRDAGAFPV
ncbi:MAG: PAS domain S-box protein, partial [Magnetococcales bacterium]|nr:PAS domain S-box protein [Magnetococcales bacterium]